MLRKISLTELQHVSNLLPQYPLNKGSDQSVFSLDIYHITENVHWIEIWMWEYNAYEYQPINISMKFLSAQLGIR